MAKIQIVLQRINRFCEVCIVDYVLIIFRFYDYNIDEMDFEKL